MEERIKAVIAAMQETLSQLEEGLISAREAHGKCIDTVMQQMMTKQVEQELTATEA